MKRIIYFTLLLIFWINALQSYAQSLQGDSHINPVPVNHDGVFFYFQDTRNTQEYTSQYRGMTTNDVFYRIIVPATMDITVSHAGSELSNTSIYLLDSSRNLITWVLNVTPTGLSYSLEPGTYYIVCEGYNANGNITTTINGLSLVMSEPADITYTAPAVNPGSNRNYILKKVPRKLIYNGGVPLTTGNSIVTIQYFDGLGRPEETVHAAGNPKFQDLVSYIQYDSYGREYKSWLPVNYPGTCGSFRTPEEIFTSVPGAYGNDSRTFSEIIYEASPLNRIEETRGPGEPWTDHPVRTELLTNTSEGVQSCSYYYLSGDNLVKSDNNYAPNELVCSANETPKG